MWSLLTGKVKCVVFANWKGECIQQAQRCSLS